MPAKTYTLQPPKQNPPTTMRSSAYWMYPDIFDCAFTQPEYQRYWEQLKQASPYTVVDQMLPKQVTFQQHTWKHLKSWLGYTNYSHPARIQMALQKILYFGYLYGLNIEEIVSFSPAFLIRYPIANDFIQACQKERNNETSAFLQEALVTFYNQHIDDLKGRNNDPAHKTNNVFYFGKSSHLTGY